MKSSQETCDEKTLETIMKSSHIGPHVAPLRARSQDIRYTPSVTNIVTVGCVTKLPLPLPPACAAQVPHQREATLLVTRGVGGCCGHGHWATGLVSQRT